MDRTRQLYQHSEHEVRSKRRIGEGDYRHLVDLPEFTRVDFDGCDAREVAAVYQALAVRLMQEDLPRILVRSGEEAPEGHVALLDALKIVMRHHGVPQDFRLALIPDTARARWVFEQLTRPYESSGLEARIFEYEEDARGWLAAAA